jgi:phosphate-selective porin OprO/OprP
VSVLKYLTPFLMGLFLMPLTAQAQAANESAAVTPSGTPAGAESVAGPSAPGVQAPTAPISASTSAPALVPAQGQPQAEAAPAISKEPSQTLSQSGFVDAGPGGFALRSADKQAQLRFHLQVQADGRFWKGTTPAKASETFFLRRAIPWIDGTLPGGISFLVAPDFAQIPSTNSVAQGNAAINLPDAYLQLKILDELQFRFGKFRAPIGLERLQPTGQLFFNEFAIATQLTPLRDLGGQVQGEFGQGLVGYAAGVFNGAVDNAYTDLDPSSYKDVEGMVYVRPFGPSTPDLFQYAVLGVAGTAGRRHGAPQNAGQSTNLPTYKSPGGSSIFSYKAASANAAVADTVIATGQQRRLNVHGYYSVGPFGLLAEYIYSQQRVGLNYNNVTAGNQGWTAEASVFLFGGKASYSQAQVLTPFDPKAGTFGALELVGRASQLKFDDSLFGATADATKPVDQATSVKKATELAGGLSWYWSRSVRILLSYNHTSYQAGAAAGANRPSENVFFGRTQLNY